MTSTRSSEPAPETPTHPILGFARALGGALDGVLVHEPAFMSPADKGAALVELARQRARLDALELKVLVAADRDDVGADIGATSTAAWLSRVTLADRAETARRVTLARALDEDHWQTAVGLEAGDFSTEHARVMVHALGELPDELEPDLRMRAEKTLVEEAHHLTPKQLRVVGKHLLEVVAPEVVEAKERNRLDRQDAAAYANARLTMRTNGDGTTDGWFRLSGHARSDPQERRGSGDRTAQERQGGARPGHRRVPDHATRMGQGMCEVLEHLPTEELGAHGGMAATVVVAVDHEVLKTGIGAAALVDGTEISPGEVRRLACGAGIIPAVLGGASAVLDLGREARVLARPADRDGSARQGMPGRRL